VSRTESIISLVSIAWLLGALLFLALVRVAAKADQQWEELTRKPHLRLVVPPPEECLDCGGDIEPARVRLGATSCAWCARTYA
jgi:hypothetical protein